TERHNEGWVLYDSVEHGVTRSASTVAPTDHVPVRVPATVAVAGTTTPAMLEDIGPHTLADLRPGMLLQYGGQVVKVSAVYDTHFPAWVLLEATGQPPSRTAELNFLASKLKSMRSASR